MSNTSMLQDKKIQLTAGDVKYLQRLFLNNAHEKLKLNLPSSSQDTKDPLTRDIVQMIENFVYDTFEMSRHSLIIDGQDMTQVPNMKNVLEQPTEEVEPFDVELNAKLRKLYHDVELETLEVTRLRKLIPAQAQDEFQNLINSDFDSKLEHLQQELDAEYQKAETFNTLEEEEVIPRLNDITQDYNETLRQLDKLKNELPAQGSEVEKLNELTQFIKKIGES